MKGAEFAVFIWGEGEIHVLVTTSVSNEELNLLYSSGVRERHVLVTNSVSNERAEFALYICGEGETCFSYK